MRSKFRYPEVNLARLKKTASSFFNSSNVESFLEDDCAILWQGTQQTEHTDGFQQQHNTAELYHACEELSEDQGQNKNIFTKEDSLEEETETPDWNARQNSN